MFFKFDRVGIDVIYIDFLKILEWKKVSSYKIINEIYLVWSVKFFLIKRDLDKNDFVFLVFKCGFMR